MGSSLNSGTLMETSLNCAVTRAPRRREGRASALGFSHWPSQDGRGCARRLRTATVPASMAGQLAVRSTQAQHVIPIVARRELMPTVETETGQTPRVDAVPKVTGRALYTEDLSLPPGTLYGAILRSPYAHARLVTINAERAKRLPGVHALVTREHLGDLQPFLHPAADGTEGAGAAPLIALEKVRYEGEPVAAVAAETPVLAQQALACIEVEYADLPALFDTREALHPEAPVLHERCPGNLVGQFTFGWGDIEQGFREADQIFEDTYV